MTRAAGADRQGGRRRQRRPSCTRACTCWSDRGEAGGDPGQARGGRLGARTSATRCTSATLKLGAGVRALLDAARSGRVGGRAEGREGRGGGGAPVEGAVPGRGRGGRRGRRGRRGGRRAGARAARPRAGAKEGGEEEVTRREQRTSPAEIPRVAGGRARQSRGRSTQDNRHNIGFMVVDELLARARGSPARRRSAARELVETTVGGRRVLLCKPMEFMNLSGQAVGARGQLLEDRGRRQIVVVHDELDLPFGRLKLGAGGGHGGHNGVRSIIAATRRPGLRAGAGRHRPARRRVATPPTTCSTISRAPRRRRSPTLARRPPTRSRRSSPTASRPR